MTALSLGLAGLPYAAEDVDGVPTRRRLDALTRDGVGHFLTIDQASSEARGLTLVLVWARVYEPLGKHPRDGEVVLGDFSDLTPAVFACLRTLIYDEITYGAQQLRIDDLLERAREEAA